MKRITVAALACDRDRVLDALTRAGTVEIVPSGDAGPVDHETDAKRLRTITFNQARLFEAIKAIKTDYPPAKTSMFTIRRHVSTATYEAARCHEHDTLAALDRWEELEAEARQAQSDREAINNERRELAPWLGLPIALDETTTATTTIVYATANNASHLVAFQELMREEAPETAVITLAEPTPQTTLIAVIAKTADAAHVRSRLSAYDIVPFEPPHRTGTPDEIDTALKASLATLEEEARQRDEARQTLAREQEAFEVLYDALGDESERLRAAMTLGTTARTVYFTGWTPEDDVGKTKRALASFDDVAVAFSDPKPGESFPIRLKNNRFIQAFDSILTLFGAPKSDEADPLPVMAPFYMLIFGMMLSDVGYGLLLTLGSAYLLYKVKVEGNMRSMLSMFMVSGVASIFWGVLFGGFFGDLITVVSHHRLAFPALWFNPMDQSMNVLIYSLLFGVIHLFAGMALKIVNESRKGRLIDGLFETVPWYLIITGCGLMLAGAAGTFGVGVGTVGSWMALSGVALILIDGVRVTKNPIKGLITGLLGLYKITGWLSDILSYARILALVLATSVIAVVFNSIAAMTLGLPTPLNYLVFALIAIPAHVMNLSLSSLSAYVHSSRLQYIEMFGKFFDGGGRYFRPLRRDTKFVNVCDDAGDE